MEFTEEEYRRCREANRESEYCREIEELRGQIHELETENEKLRSLLKEVAASGVEYDARKYIAVQIDGSTWKELQGVSDERK